MHRVWRVGWICELCGGGTTFRVGHSKSIEGMLAGSMYCSIPGEQQVQRDHPLRSRLWKVALTRVD